MKKTLLFGMSLALGISLNAQQSNNLVGPKMSRQAVPFNPKAFYGDITPANAGTGAKKITPPPRNNTITATQIGETYYDLQSNSSMARRIVNHSDGTITAIWTICPAGSPYTLRGTGYNYFDLTNWLYPDIVSHDVTDRLESIRTGFPSLGNLIILSTSCIVMPIPYTNF